MMYAAVDVASWNEGFRAGAVIVGAMCLAVGAGCQYLAGRWWRERRIRRSVDNLLARATERAERWDKSQPARPDRPTVMPRRAPYDWDGWKR